MSSKKIERKSFNSPDKSMTPSKAKAEIVNVGGFTVTRLTMEPGWKWSTDMKPVVKTDSCEEQHNGVCISGRVKVRMDDGTEVEYGPGDAWFVPPGHDMTIVGTEPLVGIEWK